MPGRIALLAATAVLAASGAAGAPPRPDVSTLRGEFQAQSQAGQDAGAEAAALKQEIAGLDAQLAALRTLQASGEQAVGGKRARLETLNAREQALSAQMAANQAQLSRLLGALELYRRNPPPALLISPRSAEDAVRATILIRAVEPELARRAQAFRAEAEALQRVRRAIEAMSEDLFTSESALAEGRAKLEHALAEKTALERQLDADAADAGRNARSLAGELRGLGVDADTLKPGRAGAPSAAPTAMRPPVDGDVVRRFGGTSQGGRRSDGVAWRTQKGAVVRAPAAGIVEYSGALKGWGGVVILGIGGGYHLVLAGLDRVEAAAGRTVAAGEPLGAMAAEAASPPELYLEVRKDGAPQDPGRWLKARGGDGR